MRRFLSTSLVALLGTVILTAGALAAAPKKGGVYQGELFATSAVALPKKVRLVVDRTGKGARVIWWCGTGRAPSTLRIQINADGTFKGTSNVGTLTVWGVKGRFVSGNTARMALQLKTICDAKGGTVNLALRS